MEVSLRWFLGQLSDLLRAWFYRIEDARRRYAEPKPEYVGWEVVRRLGELAQRDRNADSL